MTGVEADGTLACTACAAGKRLMQYPPAHSTGLRIPRASWIQYYYEEQATYEADCVDCARGTYAESNSTVCHLCAVHADTSGTASTSATACVCMPGYYFDVTESACRQCQAGTYKDTLSDDACQPCPDGTFTNTLGSTSCTPCEANTSPNSAKTDCLCHTGHRHSLHQPLP